MTIEQIISQLADIGVVFDWDSIEESPENWLAEYLSQSDSKILDIVESMLANTVSDEDGEISKILQARAIIRNRKT